jgi:PAS domain S-box-containing protein
METPSRRSGNPLWRWVEAVPDAILLVRTDGAIAELNHNAELLFGYSRDELCGRTLDTLLPERFRGRHAAHLGDYMRNPKNRPMGAGMELWGLRKDGREFRADIALSPWESPDGLCIICSIRDLSGHWLQHALEEKIGFERLVTDISACFVSLPDALVGEEIERALKEIVEFMGVDRSGVGEFSPEDGTINITHSYAVPGIPPMKNVNLDQLAPWFAAQLRRGRIMRLERLPDETPPEAEAERAYIAASGIKAVLTIPLQAGGEVAYILSVGSFRSYRKWPDEYVHRLQLLGEIFVSALQRKRAHQALLESEEKFRLLAETAACGIAIYQDGRFRYINRRATEITGYSMDALLSMSVEQLVHPDFRALVAERAQARLRGETLPARYEICILTKHGEERWVDFTSTVAQYKGRPAIIGTAFDVTERKQAEAYLQEVSGRLIVAQEEERSRIARELHDDLSQRLALVTIGLDELGQRTAEAAMKPDLESLSAQTKEIAAEVHHLSRELHPSQLEMLGLVAAVQSSCTEVSRQMGLRVEFVHEGVPRTLPPEVRLCLYRVVQEALQNVSKHSGASQVRVELHGTSETLILRIVDQGVGFDPDADTTRAGLGLISMRERVRLVNGRISVYSAPSQGTHIEVRVPLSS